MLLYVWLQLEQLRLVHHCQEGFFTHISGVMVLPDVSVLLSLSFSISLSQMAYLYMTLASHRSKELDSTLSLDFPKDVLESPRTSLLSCYIIKLIY